MIVCYLKPTNFCSVGCEHCYLTEEIRADKTQMNKGTLINSCKTLLEMASKRGETSRDIMIIWHGGEPLMLPPDFFFEAGRVLDEYLPGHIETIQTSLIPYSRRFEKLVRERFSGGIGTSIDFSQRKINSSSERYLDVFLRKANLARDAGFVVIPGMVPTKTEIGKESEIIDWFYDNGFDEINIDRYNSFGGDVNEFLSKPTNEEHSIFLINLYEEMVDYIRKGLVPPSFNQIGIGIRGVLSGFPGDRWGGSCQSDFIVIEPDGSTNSCPDRSSREESHGNVNVSLDSFLTSTKRKEWIKFQTFGHMNRNCPTCEFSTWCKSGCPLSNNDLDKEKDCSGHKTFLLHVQKQIQDPFYKEASEKIMGLLK